MSATITLFDHYSEIPGRAWLWPHFPPKEVACRCCGEVYLDPVFMDRLEALRALCNRPVALNSGHRCPIHNARVGGAPLSEHKKIAADVRLSGHQPQELLNDALKAGFSTFGFYQTFLHMDLRPGRRWSAKGAEKIWNG